MYLRKRTDVNNMREHGAAGAHIICSMDTKSPTCFKVQKDCEQKHNEINFEEQTYCCILTSISSNLTHFVSPTQMYQK